jgi:hypothetical protein
MRCHICGSKAEYLGTARILSKYQVKYFQCQQCGFVQTEEPYWIDEAYSSAITHTDIGYTARCKNTSTITCSLASLCFNPNGRFLDFGGGYGLFVRMMRDKGFDFHWHDKFCSNLFATGFEVDEVRGERWECITAFEVVEHMPNPLPEISRLLTFTDNLFFSTYLAPIPAPPFETWPYYGCHHGQHVSIFSRRTLEWLAAELDVHLLTDGSGLHLLTRRSISPIRFRLATHSRVAPIVGLLRYRGSLLESDHAFLVAQASGTDGSIHVQPIQ